MRSHSQLYDWLPGICVSITCLVAVSCAVPVAPTGGDADARPPKIETTVPTNGATSFSGDRLRITFSEYVNEGSFARAFSITPDLVAPADFSWRRRSVTVTLPGQLRDNTTYRVTVDKELRDMNGVSLREPIVFAFSTGPEINEARLVGFVVDGVSGRPVDDFDVLAFAPEDVAISDTTATNAIPLPERPLYRTQTGPDGTFEFSYLAPGSYFVVGLGDRNGNRLIDEREQIALPDRRESHASASSPDSVRLASFLFDETHPTVRRARAASDARIEVTYSEPVVLPKTAGSNWIDSWVLADSASGRVLALTGVFVSQRDPETIVVLRDTTSLWTDLSRVMLTPAAVTDSSGNRSEPTPLVFSPSTRRDTTKTRLISTLPVPAGTDSVATMTRREWPVFALNETRSPDDWLSIRAFPSGETVDFRWFTIDGRSYRIEPVLTEAYGIFSARIDRQTVETGADSTSVFWFRKLRAGELGEVSVRVLSSVGPPVVQIFETDDPTAQISADVASANRYTFDGLRPGRYGVRAFADIDRNGMWNPGRLIPFEPGEPITWAADSITVRARFETDVPDTLYIRPLPHE